MSRGTSESRDEWVEGRVCLVVPWRSSSGMRLAARVYPPLRSHDLLKRSSSRPAVQLKTWFLMTFPRFQSRPSVGMQPLVVRKRSQKESVKLRSHPIDSESWVDAVLFCRLGVVTGENLTALIHRRKALVPCQRTGSPHL